MSFFDAPIARCEAVRQMVLTDETQAQEAGAHPADAVQILGSAPEFDLVSVRVAEYTALHPEVFSGVANQALTIAQLQAMERLHKLTSSASEIKAMKELGFDSAQSIVRLGSARFQELLAGALGEGRAAAALSGSVSLPT